MSIEPNMKRWIPIFENSRITGWEFRKPTRQELEQHEFMERFMEITCCKFEPEIRQDCSKPQWGEPNRYIPRG